MRSGVATALSQDGAPAQDAALVTRHAAFENLTKYVRPRPGRVGTAARLGL